MLTGKPITTSCRRIVILASGLNVPKLYAPEMTKNAFFVTLMSWKMSWNFNFFSVPKIKILCAQACTSAFEVFTVNALYVSPTYSLPCVIALLLRDLMSSEYWVGNQTMDADTAAAYEQFVADSSTRLSNNSSQSPSHQTPTSGHRYSGGWSYQQWSTVVTARCGR